MGDVVGPVAARHVVEHALAPGVVEVDVDVGHGDAVGVEEPLEEEIVLERIDVGDPKRVGHRRAGRRAAPRPHPHPALLARGADVVADDEEVAGEAHQLDRPELELEPRADVVRQRVAPAFRRARPDERGEVVRLELHPQHLVVAAEPLEVASLVLVELGLQRVRAEPLRVVLLAAEGRRNRELRHDRRTVEPVLLDPLGDLERVRHHLRTLGEQRRHLVRRLEVLLAGVHEALLVR